MDSNAIFNQINSGNFYFLNFFEFEICLFGNLIHLIDKSLHKSWNTFEYSKVRCNRSLLRIFVVFQFKIMTSLVRWVRMIKKILISPTLFQSINNFVNVFTILKNVE